jgi:DNA-binding PadR family transcriptional regulator
MSGAMSTRHFVLGLLSQQPMSGYDIKRFLESLSWLIDSPSFGTLYPALHALLDDGLVTVRVVPGEGKPPRKIYSSTKVGRLALREWIDQPVDAGTSVKTFVMRLALAGCLAPGNLTAHLEQRRAQVAASRSALEQSAEAMDEDLDLGERLTLGYALCLAAAELNWLDRTLARLSRSTLYVEAVENVAGG